MLRDFDNDLLISAVCAWEIAIKYARGRLSLIKPPAEYVPASITAIGGTPLGITHDHVLGVADLPALHRDPFDRLLVVQAQLEGLTIVTADAQIQQYPVEVLAVD